MADEAEEDTDGGEFSSFLFTEGPELSPAILIELESLLGGNVSLEFHFQCSPSP